MIRVSRNLGIKIAAFFITGLFCLNAETDRMVEVDCTIPIHYVNLPDSLVRMGSAPDKIQVRSIFNRKFWQTKPHNLYAEVDLSRARRGTHRFSITPNMVKVSSNRKTRVVDIVDSFRIPLTFERKIHRRVDVFSTHEGNLADGYVIYGRPETDPERVMLSGPESILESITEVSTVPAKLDGVMEDLTTAQAVDLSAYTQVRSDPPQVLVRFDIERIEDRILQRRPIRTAPRYRITVEPDSIDLVIRGPAAALADVHEDRVRLFVDLSDLPVGDHSYRSELLEGNRIRFLTAETPPVAADTDSITEAESEDAEVDLSPELVGEVQNLADGIVLVDFSPRNFRYNRRGN